MPITPTQLTSILMGAGSDRTDGGHILSLQCTLTEFPGSREAAAQFSIDKIPRPVLRFHPSQPFQMAEEKGGEADDA